MAAEFPDLKQLSGAYRAVRPADADAVRPNPAQGIRPAWGTLGAAIDHRIRYAFTDQHTPSGAVNIGMTAAVALAPQTARDATRRTATALLADLAGIIGRERPFERARPIPLAVAAEQELNRLCYAMAWFEEAYRSGRLWPGTPLGDADPELTLARLLGAVPTYAIADLAAQVRLADSALAELRAAHPPEQVHIGPTFAGSRDVGGADADLIVGGLLLDIKAKARTAASREEFYQLLGYVLLDYDNRYRIDRVGLYLSRFGHLITWTITEYLSLLGCRRPVAELRELCAAVTSN